MDGILQVYSSDAWSNQESVGSVCSRRCHVLNADLQIHHEPLGRLPKSNGTGSFSGLPPLQVTASLNPRIMYQHVSFPRLGPFTLVSTCTQAVVCLRIALARSRLPGHVALTRGRAVWHGVANDSFRAWIKGFELR